MVSENHFHNFGEPTKIDDSTVILMVFWCPKGSPDLPKGKKNEVKSASGRKTTKNARGDAHSGQKNAPGEPKVDKTAQKAPPRVPAGWLSAARAGVVAVGF